MVTGTPIFMITTKRARCKQRNLHLRDCVIHPRKNRALALRLPSWLGKFPYLQTLEPWNNTIGVVCVSFLSGHVGPPLPCNKIKLVDVPEMEYYAKEGKGEVCISVFFCCCLFVVVFFHVLIWKLAYDPISKQDHWNQQDDLSALATN